MTPKALIPLLFEHARRPIGRLVVGILLAGYILYIGIKGVLTGEVWVPSSKPWTTDGIQFGRFAGLSASLAYFFLGSLIHYIGFWKRGRLEDTKRDIAALLMLALCAATTLGFIVLSIVDV